MGASQDALGSATDQELPLPGTHNPHEPAHALRDRITFAFAPELDLLLEKATQVEPGSRITMGDMARELHACLSEPPEVRPSASLDELHARAAALTATSRQNLAETQDRRARYTGCWDILRAIVADTASELADLLTFEARMQENGYQADTLLERASFMPYEADSSGWLLMPSGQPWPVVEVVVAGSMRAMRENDPMDVAALLTVNKIIDRRMHDVDAIYSQTYGDVPVSSAQQANVLDEIRASFKNCLDAAMRKVISILADSQPSDSESG
jgi:hypothetical protein